jgi:glycosyltransferase involved in cell wall biosynthesis
VSLKRLLFASCHGYLDPSSGAALATRDLLELLASRGVDCRVFSTGVLDFEEETPLESVLDPMGVSYDRAGAILGSGGTVEVIDLTWNGVRITLLPTASSRADRAPSVEESRAFLDLAEQALDRFRPQVLLTYGGHPANLELMARARRRKIAVVFHLHNFGYPNASAFANASAVLVPSEFSRRFHAQRLGRECTAIPYPLIRERVVAADPEPRYLTFVNPQPAKGATVFARIAVELGRRRPDIPILVVEGRRKADGLAGVGLDLSGLENLHRMQNTPDPRDIYRVSRAVLVPSLWRESFGRVAAEAMANSQPVLASDRGALPETLGDSGFLFTIPARCTPGSGAVPTAREVAPWIATVERLWDHSAWEQEHRARAAESARRWDSSRISLDFERFFGDLGRVHESM